MTSHGECGVPWCTQEGDLIASSGIRCDEHKPPAVTVGEGRDDPERAAAWSKLMTDAAMYAMRMGATPEALFERLSWATDHAFEVCKS